VYYYDPPSEGEKLGHWMGRAHNYGDNMCFWILTQDTEQLIVRGTVRSAVNTTRPNRALEPHLVSDSGEIHTPDKKVRFAIPNEKESDQEGPVSGELEEQEVQQFPILEKGEIQEGGKYKLQNLPVIVDPNDLIDKYVYYDNKKAKVVEQLDNKNFRVSYDKGKSTIMDYNEIIRQLTHLDEDDHERWEIEDILDHRYGTGTRKGQMEVLIKWKDYEEPTWEPMSIIKEDDPITLAQYAETNQLLDKAVWKWAKRYLALSMSSQKKIVQMYAKKQMKGPRYKFGEKVPRSISKALNIDKTNRTTGWQEAINKEISLLRDKFKCFKIPPKGHRFQKGCYHQLINLIKYKLPTSCCD
jgi:hypothetical protein